MGAAPPSRETELDALRGEIARLERDLEAARASSRTLNERLHATALDLTVQENKVREARLALELSTERIAAGERSVADLETRLDRLRESLRVHLVALYSVGRQRLLRLVLAMQPSTDAPAAIRQLRFLARRDALAAEEFRVTIDRLAQEREALDVERVRST